MFSVAALIATAATAAIPGRSLNVCNADTCAHLCACVCVFDPVRCKLIKVGVREPEPVFLWWDVLLFSYKGFC
jgi:hypothetical protein